MYSGLVFVGNASLLWGQAPLTINGVADWGDYADSITLSVPSTSGYTYLVTLNGQPVPTDLTIQVTMIDYDDHS